MSYDLPNTLYFISLFILFLASCGTIARQAEKKNIGLISYINLYREIPLFILFIITCIPAFIMISMLGKDNYIWILLFPFISTVMSSVDFIKNHLPTLEKAKYPAIIISTVIGATGSAAAATYLAKLTGVPSTAFSPLLIILGAIYSIILWLVLLQFLLLAVSSVYVFAGLKTETREFIKWANYLFTSLMIAIIWIPIANIYLNKVALPLTIEHLFEPLAYHRNTTHNNKIICENLEENTRIMLMSNGKASVSIGNGAFKIKDCHNSFYENQ